MSDREDNTYSKENVFDFSKKNGATPIEGFDPMWIRMSDVQSKVQPWFWPGMIPDETLTLFAGVGGIGKSLLLLYIVAKTTTGEDFKAGGFDFKLPPGNVILLSAEDECDSQIKPKLLAMGGNPEKVYYIKSKVGNLSGQKKFLELDKDLFMLEQQINLIGGARIVVIDPIAYFLGNIKDHVGTEVANFLNGLIELAKKYKLAILLNKHLRKHAAGSKGVMSATSEVGGAGAWTNTPRKCWLITSHHEDVNIKVITQMKDNLNKSSTESLAFKIVPIDIEDGGVAVKTTSLAWLDQTIIMSADEAVDKETFQKGKLEQALDFIYNYLVKNGQSLVKNIEQDALKRGINSRTFRKAYEQFEQIYSNILVITKGVKGAKIYQLKEIS